MWALGILLYTIVYKENPFYSIDEIMDHDLRVPYILSEDCIDLIRKMLDRDVERRIAIQAVLEHPWTTFVDEEDAEEDGEDAEMEDGDVVITDENGKKSSAAAATAATGKKTQPTQSEIVRREGKGKVALLEEKKGSAAEGAA